MEARPGRRNRVGHAGDHVAFDNNRLRVETGFVSLVTTPVGGALWGMGEDLLDRHVITRLEDRSRNPLALFAYQFLSPARGTANILRFRPPWYRDTRVVKADSFWSDPGPGTSAITRDLPPPEAPREELVSAGTAPPDTLLPETSSSSASDPSAPATPSSAAITPARPRHPPHPTSAPAAPTSSAPGGASP